MPGGRVLGASVACIAIWASGRASLRGALGDDHAVVDLQVLGADLEHLRRDGEDLLLHLAGGHEHRTARPGRGPAPAGADEAEGGDAGVAVDHLDVIERHAHLVGGHLGQGRLVALAVRGLGGDHEEVPVGLEPDPGLLAAEHPAAGAHLGRPGCGLDEGGETDAEVAALGPGGRLLPAEPVVVDELEGPVEGLTRRDAGHAEPGDEPILGVPRHHVACAGPRPGPGRARGPRCRAAAPGPRSPSPTGPR